MTDSEKDLDDAVTAAQLEILAQRSDEDLEREYYERRDQAADALAEEHALLRQLYPDIPVINLTATQDILNFAKEHPSEFGMDLVHQALYAIHERLLALEGLTLEKVQAIINKTEDPEGPFAEIRKTRHFTEQRMFILQQAGAYKQRRITLEQMNAKLRSLDKLLGDDDGDDDILPFPSS